MAVVRAVMENPEILWYMQQSRMLPIEQLVQITGVKRKILERHRKYLIAVSEISCGEYEYLRDYLPMDQR